MPPGAYKVAVTWNKPTGRKVVRPGVAKGPGSDMDEIMAVIPSKYNSSTTLTAEVTADKREHDFPLKK